MKKRTKKMSLVATAISTLLSATVAIAVISMAKKASTANDELKKEENGEYKTVLDGPVNAGAIARAKEEWLFAARSQQLKKPAQQMAI